MPSGTLSSNNRPFPKLRGWFNPTLFKKDLTRFWPIWGIYAGILFFMLPMEIVHRGMNWNTQADPQAGREFVTDLLAGACQAGIFLSAAFGLFAAMALFSYLVSHRACQTIHTLPVRREGLFLTNWLSGLWFFAVPNAVIALLSAAAGMVYHLPVFPDIWLWFLIMTAMDLFFFCFAVCCAMFTGNLLALPVFYGILNVLVIGICALIDMTLDLLLVGFSGSELVDAALARWCTPPYQLWHLLNGYADSGAALYAALESPVGAVCYCIVLGAVFTFIAVAVYRFRQLERAGDLVTVGWVRPVFQYGFGTCVGLCLGWVLYLNFFEGGGPWAFILLAAAWAAAGAFAGRMLLKKTLRVLDGWRGVAIFAAVLLLLLGGARADLFGYQRYTPDPAQVESVTVKNVQTAPWDEAAYTNITLTDPQDVSAVVALHRALVADLERLDKAGQTYCYADDGTYETMDSKSLGLVYTLRDGSTVERQWSNVPITAEELARPDSYAARLQALMNRPNAVWSAYMAPLEGEDFQPVGCELTDLRSEEEEAAAPSQEFTITVGPYDDEESVLSQYYQAQEAGDTAARTTSRTLSPGQAARLWQAVQADLAAGDLGRRYLLNDKERYDNSYQSDLILTFTWTATDEDGQRYTNAYDVRFGLQKSAANTLKVLDELGYKARLTPWERGE